MFLKIEAQAFEAGDFLIKIFLIKKCVLLVYCITACIYTLKVNNWSKETTL